MDSSQQKQARSVGRVEGAIMKLFTKAASVSELAEPAAGYRLITLRGPELRAVRFRPGMKLQVALGGWTARTYTPIEWDAAAGVTRLLAYVHGATPGGAWVRGLAVGASCTLFGPRDSLDLNALGRPALLFGDETSIGLAHALRHTQRGAAGVSIVLEVSDKSAAEAALAKLQLEDVALIARTPDDAHLAALEELVAEQVKARSIESCALSGKASSIQRVNKKLRALGLTSRQLRTKAYWAPGKVGLD